MKEVREGLSEAKERTEKKGRGGGNPFSTDLLLRTLAATQLYLPTLFFFKKRSPFNDFNYMLQAANPFETLACISLSRLKKKKSKQASSQEEKRDLFNPVTKGKTTVKDRLSIHT